MLYLLAVDSATKAFFGVIGAGAIAGLAAWWGSHLNNRQAVKDGQTAYYASLTDSQHLILEEREQQIKERDGRIAALETDVRKLKSDVAELHAENYRANRRWQECEAKHEVALREILTLRRQVAGD